MLSNAILNLLSWIIMVGVCAFFLYFEDSGKPIRRILECEALVLCLSVCESLGVILIQWILQIIHINVVDEVMLHCLEVAFSKIILIFLYYIAFSRLMRKKNIPPSKTQYSVYTIVFVYSFINMLLIAESFMEGKTSYLWAVNMGCIVLADLYLLYFIKMANEKSFYENEVKILEQQASLQYEYYLTQTEKYNATIQILHDVNKHIKAIEELYLSNQGKMATEYTKKINDTLKPLIPVRYTGNPILDILLTDKYAIMKEKDIVFSVKIDNVDLKYIESIDVTTIFGNLLDNSIEAAEKVNGSRIILIKISSYHQMISVTIENSSNCVKWKNGMPVSDKGKDRGIGILNVRRSIEKYDGDIKFKWEDNKFIVQLFLNI